MSTEELTNRLTQDLETLRIPINEVDFELRPFSTTYYGRYYPSVDEQDSKPRLFIYPYKNKEGELYDYDTILDTVIHEMVHHIQYSSSSFIRVKGVMHDPNFWKLYNRYIEKAKDMHLMKGDKKDDE